MIISRTPLRISFAGGGSDLPAYYQQDVGAVLSTTINKYIYITVNRKFDDQIRASYSRTETVDSVDELHHELIRESLRLLSISSSIEITSISDIPSRGTGLGSSSSYTVGLLNALYAHTGRYADSERLAGESCDIEINRCDRVLGKQDHYIAAYGGLKFIQFNSDDSVYVDPVICTPGTRRDLQDALLLLYTGITRSSTSILEEQTKNTTSDVETRSLIKQMVALAFDMRKSLQSNDLQAIGEILHVEWQAKRCLASGITNDRIDDWYRRARKAGAIGGKILGAGGGGFLLLFAHPETHFNIIQALPDLRPIPFHFEPQGSKIIFIEENGLGHQTEKCDLQYQNKPTSIAKIT